MTFFVIDLKSFSKNNLWGCFAYDVLDDKIVLCLLLGCWIELDAMYGIYIAS